MFQAVSSQRSSLVSDRTPERAALASRSSFTSRSALLPITAATLAAAIFVLDTLTDLEIAAAALYVAVILLSVRFCHRRGVLLVGGTCVALTIVSYLLTRSGSAYSGGINGVISLAAIAATTYLVLKIESAQAAIDETRAQLAHVSRVTTLGELTAAIAHEVNQPLTAVVASGNASLRWLAADPPDIEDANRAIERIVREATRASEIVGRIRDLAKRAPSATCWFDLAETISATMTLVQGQVKQHSIALRTAIETDLPLVRGDQVQLQQVILNLLVNAVEALADVGPGSRELRVSATQNGQGVVVTIADTGKGFGPDGERMFDAFTSTKPQGLGMGLAIARTLIEVHGGRIWTEANQPRGARVRFLLPLPAPTRGTGADHLEGGKQKNDR
ncbi:sensor histidine kinase [Bradyrhizobium niftali]|uniref:histidine kinase n=1 Tax=Bradyrhizobium niftali TaxID=2560055 RepID=A0A4Y9L7W4_9BRAD|nr:ATP-binding protein [Bradyrhizobium niftali]TFV38979.1 GHKL domain-containing protein [Bradyrhizobium niftali]